MDIYHIWCDREGDIPELEWAGHMRNFLQKLKDDGLIEGYRITRCKMGFRSIPNLPEFHIMVETRDMGQLEAAFQRVAAREGELEDDHRSFNRFVGDNIQHALYRDWP